MIIHINMFSTKKVSVYSKAQLLLTHTYMKETVKLLKYFLVSGHEYHLEMIAEKWYGLISISPVNDFRSFKTLHAESSGFTGTLVCEKILTVQTG